MIDRQIAEMVKRSAIWRFFPNKIHGDELISPRANPYQQAKDEWLDKNEVADLLQNKPDIRFVLVDKSEPVPAVFEFKASGTTGWARIHPHYISDDGYPPPGLDSYLVAHLWSNENGDDLVVFELEC